MKRLLPFLLLSVTIGLCGCPRGGRQAQDPFIFGRPRIPPPATGAVSGENGDPAYLNAPRPITDQPLTPARQPWREQPGTAIPGNSQPGPSQPIYSPPTTNPGGIRPYDPPGGQYHYEKSSLQNSKPPTSPTLAPPATFAAMASSGNTDTAGDDDAAVSRVAMTPRTGSPLAGRERVIRILQPRSEPAAADAVLDSSPEQPAAVEMRGKTVDITDLPRAR
ncbi:MAG: hypothetical protein HQ567_22400 [Candidatus Nealsonbacteria bacterium]|nr:hypothetical protein [Candidatus Nealsonbacteria bacterium]